MKLISFFGGDAHTGCTTVADAVARTIASRGSRTLFISASGKASLPYTQKELCHSIDDIRASLISDKLSREELAQAAEQDGALEIIGDVRNTYTSKLFPVDTFKKIKRLSEDYSYIVVDGGSRMDIAMAISALNESDERYFVISQSPVCLHRFKETDDYILRQLQTNFKIILNRFSREFAFYRRNEMEAMIERKIDYIVPDIEYGAYAQFERRNVLLTKGGKRSLNEITDGILQENSTRKSRGFFSRGLFGESKEKH